MKALRIALILVALAPIAAFADSVSFSITVPDANLSSSPGPYGTVNLNLNPNGTITVTVNMAPGYLVGGGGAAFGFNSGASIIGSDLTVSGLPSGFSCCTSGQMNGFGSFAFVVTGPPASGAVSTLSFTVSTSQFGTTGFMTVSQLVGLSGGNAGEGNQDFGAHVIPTNGNPTGFAGGSTQVPERGDLAFLLSSLVCFGGMLLFKRQRTSAG